MIVNYALPFLVILTILVFVHEMGHFWVARRNNVRVEVFSVGFGPEIYGYNDRHGTRWKIGAIPLGGYVKMFGEGETVEEDEKERPLTPEEMEVSFHHKRLGQRAAIVAAGPAANYIFAIVVLAFLYGTSGAPSPQAGIGSIQVGSAAEEAGLQIGDKIISIAGQPVRLFVDLRNIISKNAGATVDIELIRGDSQLTVKATPKPLTIDEGGVKHDIGLLGVTPHPEMIEYESLGPVAAVGKAAERTYDLTAMILVNLGEIISGERSGEELGGPLRIAHYSGQVFEGGWVTAVFFLAALSINLGLINLFPIPMLDGGHLVFYVMEALLGRPIGPRAQEYSFRFGLILVFIVMIYATWNDLEFFKVL
ncbi:MAG: RIP metalloprotease RseP [Rhodospirillaceae bacterium]|nr:RIP metalloprotease RseP [Rhodospirillaceae bacterium]